MVIREEQLALLESAYLELSLKRLDKVLVKFSQEFAHLSWELRRNFLAEWLSIAGSHGIKDEMTLGYLMLLFQQFGIEWLEDAEAGKVLSDETLDPASRVYNCWELLRRSQPEHPLFEAGRQ